MTLQRLWMPSPNHSSRAGSAVRLVVIHTAEGSTSIQSLGNYFANPDNQVSSHTGIDDTPNTVAEYVNRTQKAWTSANANPYSIQTELCAFAEWSAAQWASHPTMLRNTALWIAEEAAQHDIPLVKLSATQAQDGRSKGVCGHIDLGAAGGGHWDPGPNFPWSDVMAMAGGAPEPAPGPTLPPGAAPAFPWPSGHYIGQPDPDPCCHSGQYGDPDTSHVRTWQAQMDARGWDLAVDGSYGPQSQRVCEAFQEEKGLPCDGLVGVQTWYTTWAAPVT